MTPFLGVCVAVSSHGRGEAFFSDRLSSTSVELSVSIITFSEYIRFLFEDYRTEMLIGFERMKGLRSHLSGERLMLS